MWQGAGVVRTEVGLAETQRALDGWLAASSSDEEDTAAAPGTLAEAEDRNLLTVGHALVCASLARTESRGAHQRVDHPATDPRLATSTAWIASGSAAPTPERTDHADSLSR